jgi:hypothetical protein
MLGGHAAGIPHQDGGARIPGILKKWTGGVCDDGGLLRALMKAPESLYFTREGLTRFTEDGFSALWRPE